MGFRSKCGPVVGSTMHLQLSLALVLSLLVLSVLGDAGEARTAVVPFQDSVQQDTTGRALLEALRSVWKRSQRRKPHPKQFMALMGKRIVDDMTQNTY